MTRQEMWLPPLNLGRFIASEPNVGNWSGKTQNSLQTFWGSIYLNIYKLINKYIYMYILTKQLYNMWIYWKIKYNKISMLGHVGIILSMNNILYCLAYLNTLHTQWGNTTTSSMDITSFKENWAPSPKGDLERIWERGWWLSFNPLGRICSSNWDPETETPGFWVKIPEIFELPPPSIYCKSRKKLWTPVKKYFEQVIVRIKQKQMVRIQSKQKMGTQEVK